jgi:hypothetical protein
MTKEFNLSNENHDGNLIRASDVREFIRLLKESLCVEGSCNECDYVHSKILELAGDKLI